MSRQVSVTSGSEPLRIPACFTPLLDLNPCRRATAMLGWTGHHIHAAPFGQEVCIVATIIQEEHERRIDSGAGAFPAWDGFFDAAGSSRSAPAPPVEVQGVLAVRKRWPSALTAASSFVAFTPARAVLVPAREAGLRLHLEATVCEVGVLACHQTEVKIHQMPNATLGRQVGDGPIHRVFKERVYASLLAGNLGDTSAHRRIADGASQ